MDATAMVTAVGNALTNVLGWVGDVVDGLVTADGALNQLLPLFAIGIGASLFMFAFKAIRKVTWGA